jgi:hypothetical protein
MPDLGIVSKETDLTFSVRANSGYNAAMVGTFQWGPVDSPVYITGGEETLASTFYKPNDDTAVSFLSAANYLLYADSLYVARIVGSTALNSVPVNDTPLIIKNEDAYEMAALTGISFVGRYPGTLINGATVSIMGGDAAYDSWPYASEFTYAPEPVSDEFNMVLVDTTGSITGTAGTIIEKFELISFDTTAKKFDGTSAFYKDIINSSSSYLLVGDTGVAIAHTTGENITFEGGIDSNLRDDVDYGAGFSLFSSKNEYELSFLFAGDADSSDTKTMIDIASSRQDCICFLSPALEDVTNNTTVLSDVIAYRKSDINENTSYAFMDCNWKLVYDKYNDKNRYIPCSSDGAGITSRSWTQFEPWYSPAGYTRGQLRNVIKLAWNPDDQEIITLYRAQVNPIVSFPGEGTLLYGDKTLLTRPSAFSRINVRSLFITLRKAITRSSKYQLFELNDEITRSLWRNANNAYLERVQAGRGLTDFYVKADEKNNPPSVVDDNQFVGSIFANPTKTINGITLNFVAIDGSVTFDEVENSI